MQKRKGIPFEDSVLVLEDETGFCIVLVRLPDGWTYGLKEVPVDSVAMKVYSFVASKGIRAEQWMLKGWDEWLLRVKSARAYHEEVEDQGGTKQRTTEGVAE